MNMDENKNNINKKLGEKLPSHSPDSGTWQRLSAKLDAMDAEVVYQDKLEQLPLHSPNQGTWNLINVRLNRIAYYKTGVRIALSAAAGLLLLFTVSRISDQYQVKENTAAQVASQKQQNSPGQNTKADNLIKPLAAGTQKSNKIPGNKHAANNAKTYSEGFQESETAKKESGIVLSVNRPDNSYNVTASENQESLTGIKESGTTVLNSLNTTDAIATRNAIPVQSENNIALVTQSSSIHDEAIPANEMENTVEESRSILFEKEQPPVTTSTYLKQYPPPAPIPTTNKNHVALAMNYLPENIYNGTENSLFHNVDLTASYNKAKIRFNTSLGMAYNEEQIKFEMNYDINTLITVVGPGGHLDTLSNNVSNMDSEYTGTEKHKYVTYNLGIGRRLFTKGKFSTWFNAGAGFGIKLNEPDLIGTTTSSIKGQYNTQRMSVNSSRPVYNDVYVNFVTAINFNYKIINKVSFSFTPTSRWYFKPVMSLNNQATDELTLGFMSGLKFDF